MEYKTQVFLTQHDDHLRTRLTHSLEVTQISKTISLQLGLNCDLVEAIALGHDVGHTPFGHAGERELNNLLTTQGGKSFKHNIQSVKTLEILEKKYNKYDGLALTIPVLEGILKHTKMVGDLPDCCKELYVDRPFSITLEGQTVCIADEIAQITHDMDDYLRFDILEFEDLLDQPLFAEIKQFYKDEYDYDVTKIKSDDEERKKDTIIRCMVDYLVTTLIRQSESRLDSTLKAYELKEVYIKYDDSTGKIINDFHKNLDHLIMENYKIKEMDRRGQEIIETLFKYYLQYPEKMGSIKELYDTQGIDVIGDYIAGMTDRYAYDQYQRMINLRD